MKFNLNKTVAFICAAALILCCTVPAFAERIYGTKTDNPILTVPVADKFIMQNGSIAIEGEDFTLSKSMAVMADENASGGEMIKVTGAIQMDPALITDVNPSFLATFTTEKAGTYFVWVRMQALTDGNNSIYYAFNTDTYTQYNHPNDLSGPDYRWVVMTSGTLRNGPATLSFKHREAGFVVDKVIITTSATFAPVGKDDMPNSDDPAIGGGGIYPDTPIKPIAAHPRLFITKDYITKLKEYVKDPELSPMYERILTYSKETLNCKLPTPSTGNINSGLLLRIQSRALVYAMGEADAAHAKQTIAHARDYFDTVVYPNIGDITRQMGETIVMGAIAYDWCYDQLTSADKEFFIRKFKETAAMKEIGYPPTKQIPISGHSGEREIMLDLISAGVACYDEETEMYDLAAGRFFAEFVESRVMFNKSGSHPIGNAYGHTRFQWEAAATFIFARMGYENVLGEELSTVPYKWIYQRLPFGRWFKDGDDYTYSSNSEFNFSHNDALSMSLISSMYGDPYVRQQYLQYLSLNNYPVNNNVSLFNLLQSDPTQPDGIFQDELPLAYKTTYPLTSVTARTSWQQGIDSPAAMAFMNIRETTLADHNHAELGSFQLYYKGNLAITGGNYQGQTGGWGNAHDFNYAKRTIAHNCMLVFDPNEKFYSGSYQNKVGEVSNDGGQKFRLIVSNLDDFNAIGDLAKTGGVYIGPNEMTPEFSYAKSDITNAYSEKVTDYKRSMVFMDLFDEDYPAAFVVFDKIDSSDKTFKKTWLLNTVEEPVINGDTSVISRTGHGFDGKLVNKTMLPVGARVNKVGGDGYESYVNGVNYPNQDTAGRFSEQGDWRIEVTPAVEKTGDLFLNAMYVTDHSRDLPELPMFKEEISNMVGVTVKDRMVMFSKTGTAISNNVTLPVRDNGHETVSCMIADLAPGVWSVSGNGTTIYCEVTEEENALYFKGAPGQYTISPAVGKEKTQFTYEPVPKEKYGDFMVYEKIRFVYTPKPTKLIDGVPYIPVKSLLGRYDISSTWNSADDSVTISGEAGTLIVNPNRKDATLNGVAATLKYEPRVYYGTMYVATDDLTRFITTRYDALARILNISKNTTAAILASDGEGSTVMPVTISASGDDGNVPKNLVDFDLVTRWSSEGEGEWVLFDLGTAHDIESVKIAFYNGAQRATDFELEISTDGNKFTNVFKGYSSGKTTELEEFKVNANARYVKFIGYGTNTGLLWNSLTEMTVIKK